MAENSLSIILQTNASARDTLAEQWGVVLSNYAKGTIAGLYKNTDLSGDPQAGVLHAKRFANATLANYGAARGGSVAKVRALDVAVNINDNKEVIEEVEEKDLKLYGVEGLIERRTLNQQGAVSRYFERKFFNKGFAQGGVVTLAGSNIEDKLEEVIQKVETVGNDFVDGVDRADMVLALRPSVYGKARNHIDAVSNPNILSSVGEFGYFHGVITHSSVYLPETVDYMIFVKGSIAQPIIESIYNPQKIDLSDSTAFGIFLYSGTETVAPDLVFTAGTLKSAKPTATSTAVAGQNTKTLIEVTNPTKLSAGNSYKYLVDATAVAAPTWGADASDWTALTLDASHQATLTVGSATKMRIAEVASGKIIAVSDEITITKAA